LSKWPKTCYTKWYDPRIGRCLKVGKNSECDRPSSLVAVTNRIVVALGNFYKSNCLTVKMMDLSSQSPVWVKMKDMIVGRKNAGVCVLDDCLYAVSYTNMFRFYII